MKLLSIPEGAEPNLSALAIARQIAEQVDGYKGACVIGVRGMEAEDIVNAHIHIRADVLCAVDSAYRQICLSWTNLVVDDEITRKSAQRKLKCWITRQANAHQNGAK